MKRLLFTRRFKSTSALHRQIGSHWDGKAGPGKGRSWWESATVLRHVNRLVCGRNCEGFSAGLRAVVRERVGTRVFERGVSVGAGIGSKEMVLLQEGLVERFEVFELSSARVERGRALAKRLGLEERITFRLGEDAFAHRQAGAYDFVHWNNALHHMLDVAEAVAWSHEVLEPEGLFYMDDYIGPVRFQWPDASLELANRVRDALPERFFANPYYPERGREKLNRQLGRPKASQIARDDPSEAAESDRIVAEVRRHFPEAEVTLTGGVIYHLALSGVLANFDEGREEDRSLLELLLLVDEQSLGRADVPSHYGTALAFK